MFCVRLTCIPQNVLFFSFTNDEKHQQWYVFQTQKISHRQQRTFKQRNVSIGSPSFLSFTHASVNLSCVSGWFYYLLATNINRFRQTVQQFKLSNTNSAKFQLLGRLTLIKAICVQTWKPLTIVLPS